MEILFILLFWLPLCIAVAILASRYNRSLLAFGLGFFAIVSAGRSEPAAVQKSDDEKIIVMIVMIALPNGDSGVHVKPFPTAETCIKAANIEATDPFVRSVECAEIEDGRLTLRFERGKPQTLGLGVVRHFDENGKYIGSTSASPVYRGLK